MGTPHGDRADDTRVISHQVEHGRTTSPVADPTLVVAVVAAVIALFMLVIGIVTIARTGISAGQLTAGQTEVGPFARGTLMGLIEIIGGVVVGGIAASRRASSLLSFGLLSLVFGLVWLIEPHAFGDALGIDRTTAWVYLFFGAVSTGVGLWAPDRTERVVVHR